MKIRNIKENDLEKIISLIKNCERLNLERSSIYRIFWKYFRNTCFIATEEDKIVGVLLGFKDQVNPKAGYIHELGVNKEYRKRGIASNLINKFEEKIKRDGGDMICLTTHHDSTDVIKFYKKRGFTYIKEFLKFGKKRLELKKKIK